uniref:ANK_REP_REGION domain-containing protein n=1 Tax=Macrostomum lignano TaxID=282301 RepID=A0A1I8H6S2_9PLAT
FRLQPEAFTFSLMVTSSTSDRSLAWISTTPFRSRFRASLDEAYSILSRILALSGAHRVRPGHGSLRCLAVLDWPKQHTLATALAQAMQCSNRLLSASQSATRSLKALPDQTRLVDTQSDVQCVAKSTSLNRLHDSLRRIAKSQSSAAGYQRLRRQQVTRSSTGCQEHVPSWTKRHSSHRHSGIRRVDSVILKVDLSTAGIGPSPDTQISNQFSCSLLQRYSFQTAICCDREFAQQQLIARRRVKTAASFGQPSAADQGTVGFVVAEVLTTVDGASGLELGASVPLPDGTASITRMRRTVLSQEPLARIVEPGPGLVGDRRARIEPSAELAITTRLPQNLTPVMQLRQQQGAVVNSIEHHSAILGAAHQLLGAGTKSQTTNNSANPSVSHCHSITKPALDTANRFNESGRNATPTMSSVPASAHKRFRIGAPRYARDLISVAIVTAIQLELIEVPLQPRSMVHVHPVVSSHSKIVTICASAVAISNGQAAGRLNVLSATVQLDGFGWAEMGNHSVEDVALRLVQQAFLRISLPILSLQFESQVRLRHAQAAQQQPSVVASAQQSAGWESGSDFRCSSALTAPARLSASNMDGNIEMAAVLSSSAACGALGSDRKMNGDWGRDLPVRCVIAEQLSLETPAQAAEVHRSHESPQLLDHSADVASQLTKSVSNPRLRVVEVAADSSVLEVERSVGHEEVRHALIGRAARVDEAQHHVERLLEQSDQIVGLPSVSFRICAMLLQHCEEQSLCMVGLESRNHCSTRSHGTCPVQAAHRTPWLSLQVGCLQSAMEMLPSNQHSPVNVRVCSCPAVHLHQTVVPALCVAARHPPVFLCEDSSDSFQPVSQSLLTLCSLLACVGRRNAAVKAEPVRLTDESLKPSGKAEEGRRQKQKCISTYSLNTIQSRARRLICNATRSKPFSGMGAFLDLPPFDLFVRGEAARTTRRLLDAAVKFLYIRVPAKRNLVLHSDLCLNVLNECQANRVFTDGIASTLNLRQRYQTHCPDSRLCPRLAHQSHLPLLKPLCHLRTRQTLTVSMTRIRSSDHQRLGCSHIDEFLNELVMTCISCQHESSGSSAVWQIDTLCADSLTIDQCDSKSDVSLRDGETEQLCDGSWLHSREGVVENRVPAFDGHCCSEAEDGAGLEEPVGLEAEGCNNVFAKTTASRDCKLEMRSVFKTHTEQRHLCPTPEQSIGWPGRTGGVEAQAAQASSFPKNSFIAPKRDQQTRLQTLPPRAHQVGEERGGGSDELVVLGPLQLQRQPQLELDRWLSAVCRASDEQSLTDSRQTDGLRASDRSLQSHPTELGVSPAVSLLRCSFHGNQAPQVGPVSPQPRPRPQPPLLIFPAAVSAAVAAAAVRNSPPLLPDPADLLLVLRLHGDASLFLDHLHLLQAELHVLAAVAVVRVIAEQLSLETPAQAAEVHVQRSHESPQLLDHSANVASQLTKSVSNPRLRVVEVTADSSVLEVERSVGHEEHHVERLLEQGDQIVGLPSLSFGIGTMLLQHREEQSLCMVGLESRCVQSERQASFEDELDECEQLALDCAQVSHDVFLLEAEAHSELVGRARSGRPNEKLLQHWIAWHVSCAGRTPHAVAVTAASLTCSHCHLCVALRDLQPSGVSAGKKQSIAATFKMELLPSSQHSPVNVRVCSCPAVHLHQTVGPALCVAARHPPAILCEVSSDSFQPVSQSLLTLCSLLGESRIAEQSMQLLAQAPVLLRVVWEPGMIRDASPRMATEKLWLQRPPQAVLDEAELTHCASVQSEIIYWPSESPRSVRLGIASEMNLLPELKSAAMDGRVGKVRQFLRSSVSPDVADDRQRTALHWAAERGQSRVARLLIEAGAQLDAQDSSGATALHLASMHGHRDAVRLLLESEADTSLVTKSSSSALHLASRNGHLEVVQLLSRQADCDQQLADGDSPVHLAAQLRQQLVLAALLLAARIRAPGMRAARPRCTPRLSTASGSPLSCSSGRESPPTRWPATGRRRCTLRQRWGTRPPPRLCCSSAAGSAISTRTGLARCHRLSFRALRGLAAASQACDSRQGARNPAREDQREAAAIQEFACSCSSVSQHVFARRAPDSNSLREVLIDMEAVEDEPESLTENHKSAQLHRALKESGFELNRVKLQSACSDVLQRITRNRLDAQEYNDYEVYIVGSYSEGWSNSLVRLDGQTDADSDIDVCFVAKGMLFHLKGSCSCINCSFDEERHRVVEYEDGHIKWPGSPSNPSQTWAGSEVRPAVDLVWAFRCCCYPKLEVLQPGYSTHIAPSVLQSLRQEMLESPCHLVAAAPPGKDGQQLRISTTFLERRLLRSLTTEQGHVFVLIKFIIKKVISARANGLKTYIAKSLMFYLLDETPAGYWQSENLISLAKRALSILLRCLLDKDISDADKCMKHFFMRDAWVYLKKRHKVVSCFYETLRPLEDAKNFSFHPFLVLPVLIPRPVPMASNLQFHDVYDAIRSILLNLAHEECREEDKKVMMKLARRVPNYAACPKYCLFALIYLKFEMRYAARRVLRSFRYHQVSRGLSRWKVRATDAESELAVWQHLERSSSVWKLLIQADKPPVLSFLPAKFRQHFSLSCGQFDWYYVNFDALLKALSLYLDHDVELEAVRHRRAICDHQGTREKVEQLMQGSQSLAERSFRRTAQALPGPESTDEDQLERARPVRFSLVALFICICGLSPLVFLAQKSRRYGFAIGKECLVAAVRKHRARRARGSVLGRYSSAQDILRRRLLASLLRSPLVQHALKGVGKSPVGWPGTLDICRLLAGVVASGWLLPLLLWLLLLPLAAADSNLTTGHLSAVEFQRQLNRRGVGELHKAEAATDARAGVADETHVGHVTALGEGQSDGLFVAFKVQVALVNATSPKKTHFLSSRSACPSSRSTLRWSPAKQWPFKADAALTAACGSLNTTRFTTLASAGAAERNRTDSMGPSRFFAAEATLPTNTVRSFLGSSWRAFSRCLASLERALAAARSLLAAADSASAADEDADGFCFCLETDFCFKDSDSLSDILLDHDVGHLVQKCPVLSGFRRVAAGPQGDRQAVQTEQLAVRTGLQALRPAVAQTYSQPLTPNGCHGNLVANFDGGSGGSVKQAAQASPAGVAPSRRPAQTRQPGDFDGGRHGERRWLRRQSIEAGAEPAKAERVGQAGHQQAAQSVSGTEAAAPAAFQGVGGEVAQLGQAAVASEAKLRQQVQTDGGGRVRTRTLDLRGGKPRSDSNSRPPVDIRSIQRQRTQRPERAAWQPESPNPRRPCRQRTDSDSAESEQLKVAPIWRRFGAIKSAKLASAAGGAVGAEVDPDLRGDEEQEKQRHKMRRQFSWQSNETSSNIVKGYKSVEIFNLVFPAARIPEPVTANPFEFEHQLGKWRLVFVFFIFLAPNVFQMILQQLPFFIVA